MTTAKQRLLLSLAHPDDESFGSGGMMAHYAVQGVHTTLVCATGGEVGEISDPSLATSENLAEVRQAELRCACEALNISELMMLGYRDSGMAGTPENDDPRAFLNADEAEVVARLVGIIRRLRPQVVVTFDPFGGYGHPDHITIHRHTVTAFHAAGDASQYPDQGPAWQPNRLLYTVIPHSFFMKMRDTMIELNLNVEMFERLDTEKLGYPDRDVNVELDIGSYVQAKWDALFCHRTQFGPNNPFQQVPKEIMNSMMSTEFFAQVWPELEAGIHLTDIFVDIPDSV